MSAISDNVDAALEAYQALCLYNETKRNVIEDHLTMFCRDLVNINHLAQGSAQFVTETMVSLSYVPSDDLQVICIREYTFPYLKPAGVDANTLSDYDRAMQGI